MSKASKGKGKVRLMKKSCRDDSRLSLTNMHLFTPTVKGIEEQQRKSTLTEQKDTIRIE